MSRRKKKTYDNNLEERALLNTHQQSQIPNVTASPFHPPPLHTFAHPQFKLPPHFGIPSIPSTANNVGLTMDLTTTTTGTSSNSDDNIGRNSEDPMVESNGESDDLNEDWNDGSIGHLNENANASIQTL